MESESGKEWLRIPGNKALVEVKEHGNLGEHCFDIEEVRSKLVESESDRLIYGCNANNESLPFKSNSFDCYIANLSLMLVSNHTNQLKEALRVT